MKEKIEKIMALQFDNRTASRKVPVKRNTKFFSGEDFDLELNFAKEYIEQDANQTVILYRVDLEKTKVNDISKVATLTHKTKKFSALFCGFLC